MVKRSTLLKYNGVNEIGWQNDHSNITKGLRVWVYGFACANGQSKPLVFNIGERINTQQGFDSAIGMAKTMLPDGGTCPGAALERSIGQIMANDLMTRPYKAALMLTDGVFYDQPKPEKASKGLHYCEFYFRKFSTVFVHELTQPGL